MLADGVDVVLGSGSATASIVVGGDTVTTAAPATFNVTYDVMDAAGNPATQAMPSPTDCTTPSSRARRPGR